VAQGDWPPAEVAVAEPLALEVLVGLEVGVMPAEGRVVLVEPLPVGEAEQLPFAEPPPVHPSQACLGGLPAMVRHLSGA